MASSVYERFSIAGGERLIRVLDFNNDSLTEAGLRASLRVVSLADSPRFKALSYVWGSKSNDDPRITCSGHDISVTLNCYEALVSLKNLYGHFTIWVDAICINQRDKAEKGSQIPLMGEIYSWAETVYVWLGTGTPPTDRAMDCLRRTPKDIRCLEGIKLVSAPTINERIQTAGWLIKDLYWIYLDSFGWITSEYSQEIDLHIWTNKSSQHAPSILLETISGRRFRTSFIEGLGRAHMDLPGNCSGS
jgi:hypothetical protein